MPNDVLVVSITRELARGVDVKRATRGDWKVSSTSAARLRYVAGVSKGVCQSLYEIVGCELVGRRWRFKVVPTARTYVGEVPRMYGPFAFRDSSEVLTDHPAVVPIHAEPIEGRVDPKRRRRKSQDDADELAPAARLRVIQFPHPGFEHSVKDCLAGTVAEDSLRQAAKSHSAPSCPLCAEGSHVKPWKPGKVSHNRKYMVVTGNLVAGKGAQLETGVFLGFWGEWEPPSRWRAQTRHSPDHPSIIHRPVLPAALPAMRLQNTDPMVFGERFHYTNCKTGGTRRDMPPGAMVLFGRVGHHRGTDGVKRWGFGLDACFVVHERKGRIDVEEDEPFTYGEDLLTDVVFSPLRGDPRRKWHLSYHYTGRMASDGQDDPFSFFPAVRHVERPEGFARPILEPTEHLRINPKNARSATTTFVDNDAAARLLWDEVVEQVTEQGCSLGVFAQPPSWGSG